jgi:hypothetical protein
MAVPSDTIIWSVEVMLVPVGLPGGLHSTFWNDASGVTARRLLAPGSLSVAGRRSGTLPIPLILIALPGAVDSKKLHFRRFFVVSSSLTRLSRFRASEKIKKFRSDV